MISEVKLASESTFLVTWKNCPYSFVEYVIIIGLGNVAMLFKSTQCYQHQLFHFPSFGCFVFHVYSFLRAIPTVQAQSVRKQQTLVSHSSEAQKSEVDALAKLIFLNLISPFPCSSQLSTFFTLWFPVCESVIMVAFSIFVLLIKFLHSCKDIFYWVKTKYELICANDIFKITFQDSKECMHWRTLSN